MAKKKVQKPARNWALVIIPSFIILVNVALVAVALLYWSNLGWWSLFIICGAAVSIYCSIKAIRSNEPAWLLLDLILPG